MGNLAQHIRGCEAARLRVFACVVGAVILTWFVEHPVRAQNASQLTEDSFEPPRQRLRGSLEFSGAPGLAAPPGAQNLSIELTDVAIEGVFSPFEAAAEALRQRLTRGRIAVSEVFDAASEFETELADGGFILARVVVPQQTLRDGGALRLVVVDGFVERIDTSNVPPALAPRLSAVTNRLLDRASLSLRQLERPLLIAGDTYGVSLGSAISPGEESGGTVITLDPEYRRLTGFVGFDTLASSQLGGYSIDAGLEANGVLGLGEVFYLRTSGAPEDFFSSAPTLRTFALGGVVPVGTNGLTFNLEASQTETNVTISGTTTQSDFERLSARVFYPWVRTRALNLTSQLSFDLVRDSQDLVTGPGLLGVHNDRLSVVRASVNAAWGSPEGALTELGAIASIGLDTAGARSASSVGAGAPLSRPGADATFSKLEISGRYARPISETMDFKLSGRIQTSFGDPLVISEQIGVATASELSSFADVAGGLNGDSGWAVRGEASYLVPDADQSLPFAVRPYVFAAAGGLILEQPQPGERRNTDAQAFGFGVDLIREFDPAFSNASVRLEIGRGVQNGGSSERTSIAVIGNYRF